MQTRLQSPGPNTPRRNVPDFSPRVCGWESDGAEQRDCEDVDTIASAPQGQTGAWRVSSLSPRGRDCLHVPAQVSVVL